IIDLLPHQGEACFVDRSGCAVNLPQLTAAIFRVRRVRAATVARKDCAAEAFRDYFFRKASRATTSARLRGSPPAAADTLAGSSTGWSAGFLPARSSAPAAAAL